MRQKKSGWKRPALLFLVLLLLAQIGDIVYLQYFDTSRRRLPVLMYHHFADEAKEGTVVTPVRFREQMDALKEAGSQAVTIPQVIDYVENGAPLPARPILITMDDGYTSNLTPPPPFWRKPACAPRSLPSASTRARNIIPTPANPCGRSASPLRRPRPG